MAKKNVNTFLIVFPVLIRQVSRRGNKSFTLMKQKFHAGETVVSNEGTI